MNNRDAYEPLEMEVIRFESEDVITTSNPEVPLDP
jgi:hypothetical protein